MTGSRLVRRVEIVGGGNTSESQSTMSSAKMVTSGSSLIKIHLNENTTDRLSNMFYFKTYGKWDGTTLVTKCPRRRCQRATTHCMRTPRTAHDAADAFPINQTAHNGGIMLLLI